METKRVALVHDWMTGMRGGEKILEIFCEMFPAATLFTLVHKKGALSPSIERMHIETSFIQNLPRATTHYQKYLPLFPAAIEQLNVKDFELVISTSHAVAKGVIPHAGAQHLCYINTPMRYVWDMYEQYVNPQKLHGIGGTITRAAAPHIATYLRMWDASSCNRVDRFVANSRNVQRRVWRHYRRESDVIYPPVETASFPFSPEHDGYDLLLGAMVPYKRFDLAIEAYNALGHKLIVMGSGPEEKSLRRLAGSNITFLPPQSQSQLMQLYARSRFLVFPGEEDFGIVPLEAQSCGKPVVAFGRGGALETVVDSETGVYFDEQSVECLCEAVKLAEATDWDAAAIRAHSLKFDSAIFKAKIGDYIALHAGEKPE